MMLINEKLGGDPVPCDDEHLVKKFYKTKGMSSSRASMDMDMDDTSGPRRSMGGSRHSTSQARRSTSEAGRSRMPRTDSRSSTIKEVKKLNWFQRVMMCMNIDIHKE